MNIFYKSNKEIKPVVLYDVIENRYQIGLNSNSTILVTMDALIFPTDFSNEDVKFLLQKGVKMTHKYFLDDEYIEMRHGIVYDEYGYNLGCFEEFMFNRKNFENGWLIYNR